jgi:hypothetical protein
MLFEVPVPGLGRDVWYGGIAFGSTDWEEDLGVVS